MEISVKKEVPQQVAEVFSIEKMKALENLINHSDELLALLNGVPSGKCGFTTLRKFS